jgi:hypothetical protein
MSSGNRLPLPPGLKGPWPVQKEISQDDWNLAEQHGLDHCIREKIGGLSATFPVPEKNATTAW